MRPRKSLYLSLLLISLAPFDIEASQAVDGSAELQERINQLEARLSDARQTVSGLEAELAAARSGLAALDDGTAGGSATARPPETGKNRNAETYSSEPKQPVALTRLQAEELTRGDVEDLSRLEFLVPGFRYGQTGHDARLSMRGTRTNSIGPEAASVVGVYEDGIYIPTSTSRLDSIFDAERIDVLRGPQITNFGQHAYAGAVSIVNHKPDFKGFHGSAEAENALPDRTRWRLGLNIPVGDTLAFRVAGLSESRSGYINNLVLEPDSDDLNDRKEQTLRTSALWQPSDRFSILFWRKYQDDNGTGSAPWGYQQIGAYVDGALQPGHQFAPAGSVPDTGPYDVYRNFISAAQYEHGINALDLKWDMGFAQLKWLSSQATFEGDQVYDNDYSSAGEFTNSAFAGWRTDDKIWSSELRLSSLGDGPFDWLLGLYWSDRESEWSWLESFQGLIFPTSWDTPGKYQTDTQAVFGQASYQLGDRLTLSAGLRWNKESKTLKTGEKGNWDDVLWKAAAEYGINEHMTSYASVSTGYLAGGINSAPGVNPTWQPEKLTAYEIGFKGELANGRLALNLSAWYNDFKDVQSQSFLVMPFPGSPEATEYTGNGGSMDAKGVEAEINWWPVPRWQVATNIAYTDAAFGDYTAANLAGLGEIAGHTESDLLSFKGWRPALSPEWVVGLQTSYTQPLADWGDLVIYLQTTYASDYYASDINLAGVRQDAHARTDFRLTWQAPQNFEIELYWLNYSDEETLNWARVYNPAARPDITTLQANWNNPASNGIIFRYSF